MDETVHALNELLAPDPYSRTKDHEGRRLLEVDGGWRVVNGEKYRDKLSIEERREYKRAWQAEYRKRRKRSSHEAACDGAKAAIAEALR